MHRTPLARSLAGLLALAPLAAPALAQEAQALTDAETLFRTSLERRFEKDRFFSKVEFAWCWGYAPWLLLVQESSSADPFYELETAERWATLFGEVHARFVEDYAAPLELHLRDTSPRLVAVVLASAGDFTNYLRTRSLQGTWCAWCNEDERLLLVREDPFRRGAQDPDELVQVRAAAAYALLQGYGATIDAAPGPFWFRAGMAEALLDDATPAAPGLGPRRASPRALRSVVEAMSRPSAAQALLVAPSELVAFRDRGHVLEAARRRVGLEPPAGFSMDLAYELAHYESALLFHWLERGAEPDVRAGMQRYVEAVLKGRDQGRAVFDFLPAAARPGLEAAFWQYVWDAHRAAFPELPLDTSLLRDFLVARGGDAAVAAAELGAGSFVERAATPRVRFAMALVAARAGDVASARARLAALDGLFDAERLAREVARVDAWDAERVRFLEALAAAKKRLRIERDGERVNLQVEGVRDGRVQFRRSKSGPDSLALDELDAVELALAMDARVDGYEPGWARAYPLVLAERAEAARALEGGGAEREALSRDVADDYAGRRVDLQVAGPLAELEAAGTPTDLAGSARNLAAITALWSLRNDVPAVMAMSGDLQVAAREALELEFAAQGLGAELRGAVETLPDGRVRVKYDFSDERQLEDWPAWTQRSRLREAYDVERGADGELARVDGLLRGDGAFERRHVLAFTGPQSIEFFNRFHYQDGEGLHLVFQVSLCTLDDGSFAGTVNADVLESAVRGGSPQRLDPPEVEVRFDTDYHVRLEYTAEGALVLSRDGEECRRMAIEPGREGRVQLFLASDYLVDFDDIVLTGRPTAAALADLRERYVARRLIGMNL
ncbi:MAG: hypothetical protein H6828_15030 [Planctomycetes bacterium]|nr:hypothetical protein [Planctomycetota bacterium]